MRIKGWHVNGFGVFHNYSIDNLSAGLTVFVGPNEAGKSTLLAFIRTILFGFPDGRSKELKYPPLNGGRHGGRLILTARGHDYVIERHAGEKLPFVLTLSDGQCGDESDLRSLTGGADDRLFRSVFAFSLNELQVLETLTAEGVRDRIFSAGISGAGPSARAAMKELEDHSATLLRPRRQARISQLLTEINKIDEQLEKAKFSAKSYLDWVRNEEDCKIEIGRLWEKIEESKNRETHLNTLLELWPDWTHLQNIKAELNATESVAEFPADGEGGIPGYRARIRPIVSRITIHWPSFYNVVTGKTLALPNLIALQHIPLSPAGVIAKRPAPIALPNSCAAEWRMAPDAVFSPYASVRYFTPHMVHSQYNLL